MASEIFKKIEFEDLLGFLDENFYKIFSIEILIDTKKTIVKLELRKNFEKHVFEIKYDDFIDVYNKIYDFVMEKLKNDGFYLAKRDDAFGIVIFYKFIKFCEKHEHVKNLYLIYENDENKMLQEMEEMLDDYLKCNDCKRIMISNAMFDDGYIFEFRSSFQS